MIESPACTAWPARSDRCSCFCLRRIGLKGKRDRLLHEIILLSNWNPRYIGVAIQGGICLGITVATMRLPMCMLLYTGFTVGARILRSRLPLLVGQDAVD